MLKQISRSFGSLLALCLFASSLAPAQANQSTPHTPLHPPLAPRVDGQFSSGEPASSNLSQQLPPLKAVLLVGPIDDDSGSWTTQEK